MRVENWPSLLTDYLDAEPFAWGRNDCALWAAGWVFQCTGEDFRGDWLGKYTTAKGAKIRMTRLGFVGVSEIADAHLEQKPVTHAQRGDLVLHPIQGCLGICNGMTSHFVTEEGTTTVQTLDCLHAWGVS